MKIASNFHPCGRTIFRKATQTRLGNLVLSSVPLSSYEESRKNMGLIQFCLECGAPWKDGITCQENFHQMLAWELDNPQLNFDVHHLMVLSYHLQHPSLYSSKSLRGAVQLLLDFLESGLTQQEVRRRQKNRLDSSQRPWKIGGMEGARGSYPNPLRWHLITTDVISGGETHYADNVRRWAKSILEVLRATDNLPQS